jgi:thiol-disulfide isomerase/thioredoxin
MWLTLLTGCIPVLHSPDGAAASDYVVPQNAWPAAESVPALEPEGYDEGQVVTHESVPDQNGDTVDTWQFYGNVWVLDVSTIWCGPCQQMASTLQETADTYKDQGFVYLTVLRQNDAGEVPTQDDLVFWADSWGIVDQPVVADGTGWSDAITGGTAFPALLVINRDLTVSARVATADDALLAEAIEAAL